MNAGDDKKQDPLLRFLEQVGVQEESAIIYRDFFARIAIDRAELFRLTV
jgi:hypothetical protein